MLKTIYHGTGTKNILILTGVHGNEKTPILTGRLINEYLEKHDFSKENYHSITLLEAINYEGLLNNTREYNIKNTYDINRQFYQEQDNYKKIIDDEIQKSDVIIDIT